MISAVLARKLPALATGHKLDKAWKLSETQRSHWQDSVTPYVNTGRRNLFFNKIFVLTSQPDTVACETK